MHPHSNTPINSSISRPHEKRLQDADLTGRPRCSIAPLADSRIDRNSGNDKFSQMSRMIDLPPYEPSICIPRVEDNVSGTDIRRVFERLLGNDAVDSVDLVPWREDTRGRRRAFIHLSVWPDTPVGTLMRQRFMDNQEVKVVHSDPWFWRCSKSRVPRPQPRPRGPAPELAALVAEQ